MWVSFIAVAIAASIALSVANLASYLNKVQGAQHSSLVQSPRPPGPAVAKRPTDPTARAGQNNQNNVYPNPGA